MPPRGSAWRNVVAEFRVSERARADLIDIYEYTAATFGQYQAEAYYAGLERTFGLIADFPQIGPAVDELASGYRRFRFQSHLIFYTVEIDHIVVRAIIHAAMNIRPQLFE